MEDNEAGMLALETGLYEAFCLNQRQIIVEGYSSWHSGISRAPKVLQM